MGLKFYQIRLPTEELAALECLEKSPYGLGAKLRYMGYFGPTKFVQMIVLGWAWPTQRTGQISFLMHLNGKIFEKLILWILLMPKSLFLLDMLNLMRQWL